MWNVMFAQIVNFAGCLLRTEFWSAEADNSKQIVFFYNILFVISLPFFFCIEKDDVWKSTCSLNPSSLTENMLPLIIEKSQKDVFW